MSLDALVATVSADWSDVDARRALHDRLMPYSMRADFLTMESVQLVLDQATANFPWELLAVPGSTGAGSDEPAVTGSVLRLFTETGRGRLQPERARVGGALVIGAGNVEGLPSLRGAIERLRPLPPCCAQPRTQDQVHSADGPREAVGHRAAQRRAAWRPPDGPPRLPRHPYRG